MTSEQKDLKDDWPDWMKRNRDAIHIPVDPQEAQQPPAELDQNLPKSLYFDVYDDSFVTTTTSEGIVTCKRGDGRPMWYDGSNILDEEGWKNLVQQGYFLRVNTDLSPEEAARDILRRTGENI